MIKLIESRLLECKPEVDAWLHSIWQEHGVPFYTSSDIRNARYKISIIDTNLFPAGFNNLCETVRDSASGAAKAYLTQYGGNPLSVLLITEVHTRNLYYLENVLALKGILEKAGVFVICGTWTLPGDQSVAEFELPSGSRLRLHQICRKDDRLAACGESVPDLIISNNDFSAGIPPVLQNITQKIIPSPQLGWHQRRKSDHFKAYKATVIELAQILELDPWLFYPVTYLQDQVNFMNGDGMEALAKTVDQVIADTQTNYDKHGIKEEPYVFIKSNRGTYGMGIMTARKGEELLTLNRKQRNNMAYVKSKQVVDEVIVQEGIPTYERVKDMPSEPVMMTVGNQVIGGFLRSHADQGERGNLNSPGMVFEHMCLSKQVCAEKQNQLCVVDHCRDTVYSYLTLAAAAAASREMSAIMKSTEASHV